MDFKQLESFITIAKYNSFSKASRELYLTQPTLSNHIHNLEKELMTQLFERHGKTIELTPAGKIFRDCAIELVKQRDSAFFQINHLIGQFGGTVELPYSTVPGETIVPELISEFIKTYPGIRFKLNHLDSQDVIDALIEKKFSFGFVGSKPNNDFDSLKVYEDDMVLIGPKDQPLEQNHVPLEVILTLPMIIREEGSGSGSIISKELSKHKLLLHELNVVAIVEGFHISKRLTMLGTGFAFVSRSFANEFVHDDVEIYELEGINTKREFYFVHPKKVTLNPLENQFKEFVYKQFSK